MKRVLKRVLCLGFVVVLLLMGIMALRSRVPQYLFADEAAMEEPLADEMPYKEAVLAPCRMLRSALGQRIFPENDCYITDDGYMVSGGGAADVTPAADGVERLCDFCEEHGIGFLHVTTAFKPQYDEDASSVGMWCYRNANSDALIAQLEARGVPHLDLREAFRCDDYYERWFYAGDHHWNSEAGLYAARLIAEELNRDYGFDLDLTRIDDDHLTRTTYERCWVGEMGDKYLGEYGPVEDFVFIEPAYDVHLRHIVPSRGIDATGGYEVFTKSWERGELDPQADGLGYYYYLGGNYPLQILINEDIEGSNILIVKDSYACVCAPQLALMCGSVTLWDMRYENDSLFQYLEEHPEIDTVIVMYSSSYVVGRAANDFH